MSVGLADRHPVGLFWNPAYRDDGKI
ncbi:uncharacterized protein METZ01_LOCUS16589 [marine metagenome]|uniref:Uncharacterized protein n=1 Tax=marine metagenome TaxID=408172 RepID=A0A381P9T0_9ZZZZ